MDPSSIATKGQDGVGESDKLQRALEKTHFLTKPVFLHVEVDNFLTKVERVVELTNRTHALFEPCRSRMSSTVLSFCERHWELKSTGPVTYVDLARTMDEVAECPDALQDLHQGLMKLQKDTIDPQRLYYAISTLDDTYQRMCRRLEEPESQTYFRNEFYNRLPTLL